MQFMNEEWRRRGSYGRGMPAVVRQGSKLIQIRNSLELFFSRHKHSDLHQQSWHYLASSLFAHVSSYLYSLLQYNDELCVAPILKEGFGLYGDLPVVPNRLTECIDQQHCFQTHSEATSANQFTESRILVVAYFPVSVILQPKG